MDYGLAGKIALITGASGGIGGSAARSYAREGAQVAVAYRGNVDGAKQLAEELGGGSFAVRYLLEEPEAAFAEVADRCGGVDVLVTSAVKPGARRGPAAPFESLPVDAYAGFLDDNLTGTLRTVQLALPTMRQRGWGRIVLVSSRVVDGGKPGREVYGAAKAGLHGFASSLSWDVGRDGVLVNVVCPGMVAGTAGLPPEAVAGECARTPTGRLSTPDEVAEAVIWLGSGANGNVTGQVLTVAGGR
ncbi:SDR family NAD(P)-dependent oxidoreductase [Kutzneria sp. CA-103260]|uniref:SDR family NAD(P)-dependent oxidoreductase n=1 Tax=Kutzneria sp. CA-103260 TaxID=2802641 RepID=UPI001BAA492C|nr:SDR family oxidoreductase [Kutzneria sp. CA-103260]QUQ63846.1 3-oxoacyl-[acyl-carrier-protein] reductase [Kutzneria sp. CA-103260]